MPNNQDVVKLPLREWKMYWGREGFGSDLRIPYLCDGIEGRSRLDVLLGHDAQKLIDDFNTDMNALTPREQELDAELQREREAARGLVEALDNILCMHDGNQSPAMNMPDIDYARFVIRQIHNESRAALATYNDNRKG